MFTPQAGGYGLDRRGVPLHWHWLLPLAAAKGIERARLRGEAIRLVLTTLAQLSTPHGPEGPVSRRLRVCYFALLPGPPRQLVLQSHAGRAGEPTVTFDESTRAGQFLLRVVDDGWKSVEDTETQRIGVWWDEERAYRTFVAGPVPGPEGTRADPERASR